MLSGGALDRCGVNGDKDRTMFSWKPSFWTGLSDDEDDDIIDVDEADEAERNK